MALFREWPQWAMRPPSSTRIVWGLATSCKRGGGVEDPALLLGQGLPVRVGEEGLDDEAGVGEHAAFHVVDRILRGIAQRREPGQAGLERGQVGGRQDAGGRRRSAMGGIRLKEWRSRGRAGSGVRVPCRPWERGRWRRAGPGDGPGARAR